MVVCASLADASTVLFIGDSQSAGPFGKTLDQLLRAENKVMTRAVNGSVGKWWNTGQQSPSYQWNWGKNFNGTEVSSFRSTPILSKLVHQTKPDFVIMQFGGNYVGWEKEKLTKDVRDMIQTVTETGAKCMFVTGPDTYANRNVLLDLVDDLQEAVADRCVFFNSVAVTCYPDEAVFETTPERNFKVDGRHYNFTPEGEPLAKDWARDVFSVFIRFESLNSLSSD